MTTRNSQSSNKFVVLDRDGVINQDSPDYVKSAEEFVPLPGSIDAIVRLHKAGYKVVIATNQSGLGRGLFDEYTLAHIHHKLCSMVEEVGGLIAGIFYCPHTPEESCSCRKPATGLLQQIEAEFSCSLKGCYFVGDSERDLQAAILHGCVPVLVRTGNGPATEASLIAKNGQSVAIFEDLAEATEHLFFGGGD